MARYRDGLSLAEIARRRDCQRSTVCRVAKQALKKLERGVPGCPSGPGVRGGGGLRLPSLCRGHGRAHRAAAEYLYYLLSDGVTMAEIGAYLGVDRSSVKRGGDQIAGRLSAVAPALPAAPAARRPAVRTGRAGARGRWPRLWGSPPPPTTAWPAGQACGGPAPPGLRGPAAGGSVNFPVRPPSGHVGELGPGLPARYRGVDVSALPEPEPYTPAPRRRSQADLRGLLSRSREAGGGTIGDSVDARTYQRMMEVASRADP